MLEKHKNCDRNECIDFSVDVLCLIKVSLNSSEISDFYAYWKENDISECAVERVTEVLGF